jgi:hypothetical protein
VFFAKVWPASEDAGTFHVGSTMRAKTVWPQLPNYVLSTSGNGSGNGSGSGNSLYSAVCPRSSIQQTEKEVPTTS